VKKKKILVVDIGGTNVKVMISRSERRKFDSGPSMTAKQLVSKLKETVPGWKFDAVSIGFPSPVRHGRILKDPKNLGKGWVGFDFARALKKPVHVVNDAAMQALGSYHGGGRMLFLGLGTGLGSALVYPKTLLPLELGDLPYRDGGIIENYLGKPGLAKLGEPAWKREVKHAVRQLKKALIADYVVLGGGNAKRFKTFAGEVELGHNRNAYIGGVRLWEMDPRTRKTKWRII
jgi:predicted NBD/HSP70 family sugar kinase